MKSFKEYMNESEMLVEMARMNVDEVNGSLPTNQYDVRIWSNEHEPQHIHVCYPSRKNPEYEVMFSIETGELVGIKFDKRNRKEFPELEKLVKKWLDEKSAMEPEKTNREVCKLEWKRNQA